MGNWSLLALAPLALLALASVGDESELAVGRGNPR